MQYFDHINASTLQEAADLLRSSQGTAKAIAGGTDLLGALKDGILPQYPKTVVNLKTIEGLNYIKQDHQCLKVGALTKLADIVESTTIREKWPILAEAAYSVASPQIRNLATIGGNICQDVRCWYYRYPDAVGGTIQCLRKGGKLCYAVRGDNRYSSIFGGMRVCDPPCIAHCPADTDIPNYMGRLRVGDIAGAARTIMQVNPMPAITARVCAQFCKQSCSRNIWDENVAISTVECLLGDYILAHADQFIKPPAQESGKRVAIVGSGPAGLTVAYYLRQAGHMVTIYEKKEEAGGLLTYTIPAARLPKEYVRRILAAFAKIGIQFRLKTEVGVDIMLEELEKQYDTIFFDASLDKEIQWDINQGVIAVGSESQITSQRGLFGRGKVASRPATVVHSIKSGRKAAAAMNKYLGGREVPLSDPPGEAGRFLEFDPQGILKTTRAKLPKPSVAGASTEAKDNLALKWDEVLAEAKRCMNCGCIAVNPSDIGTVLLALDATIKTTKRTLSAEEFLAATPVIMDLPDVDELVTEIIVPVQGKENRSAYEKFRIRNSIDFAIVSVASAYEIDQDKIKNARLVLGAVAPVPFRARAVEEYLNNKTISEDVAAEAAELAVKGAIPLDKNGYKIQLLKALVKRAILNTI